MAELAREDLPSEAEVCQMLAVQASVLKRLHGAKKSLQAFDKASSARLDEVCAELKRNSDLLALIKADLDHIFHNIRLMRRHVEVEHKKSNLEGRAV